MDLGKIEHQLQLKGARKRRLYFSLAIIQVITWLLVGAWIQMSPKIYTSSWSLILPGSETEARVSLQGIGQAHASSRSFYDGKALDHRVNYREIALSPSVLGEAAAALELDSPLERPRIQLVDQSSIMEFEVRGSNPEDAQRRSLALYEALQTRLQSLREDELAARKKSIEAAIAEASSKLDLAHDQLATFKAQSEVLSANQVDHLAQGVLELQEEIIRLRAELLADETRLISLTSHLRLTPESAGDALVLLSDRLYLAALEAYSEASAELISHHGWGPKHPERQSVVARVSAALQAMSKRAALLLGREVKFATIERLMLLVSPSQTTTVFENLTLTLSEVDANRVQLAELEGQEDLLVERLREMATDRVKLEDLERRLSLAEAIYNSTLGKSDVGRLNIFSSYPLLQMLNAPSLPFHPSSPKTGICLVAGAAASLSFSFACFLIFLGVPLIRLRAERWLERVESSPTDHQETHKEDRSVAGSDIGSAA